MSCCWGAQAPSEPVSAFPHQTSIRHPPMQHPQQARAVQNAPDQTFIPSRSQPSFVRPLPPGCERYSLAQMEEATYGFSNDACIGEGGFGKVYRGFLEDGTCVAIKKLDRKGLQGDKEFEVEINVLARLRYKHLVTLRGACTEKKNRIAVFDFMPGGSLRDNLDRRKHSFSSHHSPPQNLLWPARIEVALGAAKGLRFLHEGIEPGMIHRDVKSSNVLLDSEGHARMADFGLAIHTGTMSGKAASQFETPPMEDAEMLTGTYGYTAPEYLNSGKMSQKSDVYAFGVVLLELLTGLEPIDTSRPEGMQSLVEYLFPRITSDYPDVEELYGYLDPILPKESVPVPQLMWFCEVAAGCLQPLPSNRLKISEVVAYLAKLDRKQAATEVTPSGRRMSTDRTENGRYTLRSLMDDEPLNVPPIREGIDLVPTVMPLLPEARHPQLGRTDDLYAQAGPSLTGNPFGPSTEPQPTLRPAPIISAPAAYIEEEPTSPKYWPTMAVTPSGHTLHSNEAVAQPSPQPAGVDVSPTWQPSPEPRSRNATAPDVDKTYSPLRSSITAITDKRPDTRTCMDAYSFDTGHPIGPLQDGLQQNMEIHPARNAAKVLFSPDADSQRSKANWVSFGAR